MSDHCPPTTPQGGTHPSDCEILEAYRSRARDRAAEADSAEMRVALARAEPIRLLLLDVDGVLTDGSLIYSENGVESKSFNTQDGLGIRLVQQAGVHVGLITARKSALVQKRAEELGLKYILQGIANKLEAFKDIIRQSGLKPYEVCYIGDDWIDLALLSRVGLAACPQNSVPEVMSSCHFVASRSGGQGAVRQVCDLVLRAKGIHEKLMQQFMG